MDFAPQCKRGRSRKTWKDKVDDDDAAAAAGDDDDDDDVSSEALTDANWQQGNN